VRAAHFPIARPGLRIAAGTSSFHCLSHRATRRGRRACRKSWLTFFVSDGGCPGGCPGFPHGPPDSRADTLTAKSSEQRALRRQSRSHRKRLRGEPGGRLGPVGAEGRGRRDRRVDQRAIPRDLFAGQGRNGVPCRLTESSSSERPSPGGAAADKLSWWGCRRQALLTSRLCTMSAMPEYLLNKSHLRTRTDESSYPLGRSLSLAGSSNS